MFVFGGDGRRRVTQGALDGERRRQQAGELLQHNITPFTDDTVELKLSVRLESRSQC